MLDDVQANKLLTLYVNTDIIRLWWGIKWEIGNILDAFAFITDFFVALRNLKSLMLL